MSAIKQSKVDPPLRYINGQALKRSSATSELDLVLAKAGDGLISKDRVASHPNNRNNLDAAESQTEHKVELLNDTGELDVSSSESDTAQVKMADACLELVDRMKVLSEICAHLSREMDRGTATCALGELLCLLRELTPPGSGLSAPTALVGASLEQMQHHESTEVYSLTIEILNEFFDLHDEEWCNCSGCSAQAQYRSVADIEVAGS